MACSDAEVASVLSVTLGGRAGGQDRLVGIVKSERYTIWQVWQDHSKNVKIKGRSQLW